MDVVEAGDPRRQVLSNPSDPSSDQPGFSPGSLTAGPTAEIVRSLERMICGPHAVASRPVAEGLALAGKRSAGLPDIGPDADPRPAGAVCPCVYHWIQGPGAAVPPPEAILLTSSSAQQAVDHVLAAHLLAERFRRPVVSLLDPGLASRIDFARLPHRDLLTALLGQPAASAPPPEPDLHREAEAILATVAAHIGRSCRPVEIYGDARAPCAIVACGAAVQEARRLAERLDAAGHPAVVVAPALLRPLPTARLAEALAGRSTVFVVDGATPPPSLLSLVRDALLRIDGQGTPCIPLTPADDPGALNTVFAHLGLDVGAVAAPVDRVDLEASRCRLGVLPASDWGRRFLLHTAAQVSRVSPIQLAGTMDTSSTLLAVTLSQGANAASDDDALDVLVAADLPMLAMSEGLSALRPGGVLVLHAPADSPDALWRALPAALRRQIQELDLSVRWINAAKLTNRNGSPDHALTLALEGALLGPKCPLPMLKAFDDPVAILIERLRAEEHPHLGRYSEWLRGGAAAVQALNPAALESARKQSAGTRAAEGDGLRMPAKNQGLEWDLTHELRRFHAGGDGAGPDAAPPAGFVQVSAALSLLFEPEARWRGFPLYLPVSAADGAAPTPLLDLLNQAMDELGAHTAEAEYLREHLLALVRDAARELRGRDKPGQFRDVVAAAREQFLQDVRTSDAGKEAMRKHLAALEARLPADGMLLGMGRQTLLELYTVMLQQHRAAAIVAFGKEVKRMLAKLEDTLRVDAMHDPGRKTSEALASSLGNAASSLLDPAALAQRLPAYRGGKRLDPAHRARVESIVAALKGYLARSHRSVAYFLVQAPGRFPHPAGGPGIVIEHAEPFAAAIGLFDGLLADLLPVFRAARAARLEIAGRYRADTHDAYLAQLDAAALTRDELMVVPSVLVLEEAQRLQGRVYASFSQWAQSGRPLQALVTHRAHDGSTLDAGFDPGLGYRAVAHRDLFVLQSSLANAGHAAAGLARMMGAAGPAVAFIGIHEPPEDHFLSWLQAMAEHRSRTHPTFVYDVAGGESWAERFDLSGNDQPDQPWAASAVRYRDPDRHEQTLTPPFTFADFAALNPDLQRHFRIIPPEAWNDQDQMPLGDYLASPPEPPPKAVPYVWVIDRDDVLQRAAVTWSLAAACRERARLWKVLQELAGINNEYARRAGEQARREDEARFEAARRDWEAAHAAEVEKVRESAAEQTIERLVAVLMDMDNLPATDPALAAARRTVAPTAPAAPAAEPVAEAPPAPAVEEEEDVSFGDPYIDGILCTSCDDCIKLNPRMFKYNDEKQAYIADASAGTFAELVKAAESCPGKCIHPGAPRSGDPTVTDELLARAAALK